ncbi:MAG: DUF262 domain-containing protein [Thaumarchaeota archaeon]|nr:DUF262 domain-containing protein [Nitrososphaerota archaeon]
MKTTLHSVLKDDMRYAVPAYQRAYSWGREQVGQFLGDLEFVHEHGDLEHFYGFVLTAGSPERQGAPLRLIDGQQRMTTVALFLVCARNFFHGHSDRQVRASKYRKTVDSYLHRPGGSEGLRPHTLTLNRPNRELFSWLVDHPDAKKEDLSDHRGKNAPNRLLADAFVMLTRWFGTLGRSEPDMVREAYGLVRTLLSKFVVYRLDYPDRKVAQRVFKLVNDRGRRLDQSDLVKNYLFDELEDRFEGVDIDEYDATWTRIIGNVTNEGNLSKMDHFLHHYLIVSDGYSSISIKPNIRRMHLTAETLVERRIKSPKTVIDELLAWSKTLDVVRNPAHAREFTGKGNVAHYLARLKALNVTPAYPAILAGHSRYWKAGKARLFEALLMACLKYHTRVQIVGNLTESTYERVLSDMADSIGLGRGLGEIVSGLRAGDKKYPSNNVVRDVLADMYVTKRTHALVLLEEAEYPDTRARRPAAAPTIEHIMPKKLDAEWHSYVIEHNGIDPNDPVRSNDEVENFRRRHVDLLGNQTLLSAGENASLSNRPYGEKRLVYGNSKFEMTQEVARRHAVWGKRGIEARQAELAGKITDAIDLDRVLERLQ